MPVTSPPGPVTAASPIILPADCAVVTSTFVCLDWQPAAAAPGGAAQVQLATFQAVKAFLPRCKVSRIPADLAAATAVNVLCVRLTGACWSRVLTELDAAQVFSQTRATVEDLHAAIKEANCPNPANLDLVAADWRAAENYALPGGNSAAAVAARRALAPL